MDASGAGATERTAPSTVAAQLAAAGFDGAREIGRGGFGIVFRCRETSLDRDVALKVLTNSLNPENLARFLREQRTMGRLSGHPNIVSILSAGITSNGLPYIAMPYLAKDSLESCIRREGTLGWGRTLSLGVRLAGALETAHRRCILHRDVKPANILLTDYGDPQLADFGIAHLAGAFDTATGFITGSPAFIAPEVVTGGPPNPSSDIYSLGATLFRALAGQAPFERLEGEQLVAQLLRITTQPTPRLHDRSDIPEDVAAAIERAIAREPSNRPTTAASFGNLLRTIEQQHNRRIDEMVFLPSDPAADGIHEPPETGTERSPFPPATTGEDLSFRTGIPVQTSIPVQPGPRNPDGNIPLELTSFIGRRRELVAAKNSLSSSRLVTLTGVGGVGKTRLALRLAAGGRQTFTDGVWLIELGRVHDEMLVAGAVAANLGILNQSADLSLSVLADYLHDKDLLLVLDNCEHLLGTVAVLAETLLLTCQKLKILATSREQLGIAGETVVRVHPMIIPDTDLTASSRSLNRNESVTLFAERASDAVPGFELNDDNRSTVAQICRRLDGLPLAIELAVGRLRAMSPQQILDRLDHRYLLLTQGSRVAPSRQQTLQMCVDWSYDLCTIAEQLTWSRITVFAGSFELDAVEAICNVDESPTDLLNTVAQLVDKSILIREQPDAVVRYRLLDTLREYGRDKLQARGEYTKLRRRHRDWYEHLARQADTEWISPRQLEWITRLEKERPNLHEALHFCWTEPGEAPAGLRIAAALFPLWTCRGLLSEGRLWFDRLLAIDYAQPTADRAKALCFSSILAGLQGDITVTDALMAEAIEASEQLEDDSLSALVEQAAGGIALYSGDPWTAITKSKKAIRAADELGYQSLQVKAAALTILGVANVMLGDAVQASLCHEQMLEATENRGDLVYQGKSSMAGGWAMWKQGEPEQAKALLRGGLRMSSQIDDPVGVTRCLTALAWIEADQHNAKRAAVLLGATAGLCKEIGGPTVEFLEKLIDHQECVRSTREMLGAEKFRTQFQLGNSLSLHDAAAYAVEEPSDASKKRSNRELSLTRRERQIAELVAEGLTNREIASRLVISYRTVQGHVEHILTKLDLTSRTQVAVWANMNLGSNERST